VLCGFPDCKCYHAEVVGIGTSALCFLVAFGQKGGWGTVNASGLVRELLGFGEHIEVLAPRRLRSKIKHRLQLVTQLYEKND
jgi:hypothetical protein